MQVFELNPKKNPNQEELIWCTTNADEQAKCFEWSQQLIRIQNLKTQTNQMNNLPNNPFSSNNINNNAFGGQFNRQFASSSFNQPNSGINDFSLSCYQTSDKDQCMNLIANERAHLVTLDPGEIFWGGRYHSLIPIVTERYGPTRESGYFAVAVVRRTSASYIRNVHELRGMKACFPGVGKMAGWVLPLSLLQDMRVLDIRDCNNVVKNVAFFFNQTCAPGALIDKHNPSGDNPLSMCSLCKEHCSGSDEYAGFEGAIKCLMEAGDVAFVKHTTIGLMQKQLMSIRNFGGPPVSLSDFELLCPDGRRAPLDSYRSCNLGFVPADAVVTLSSVPIAKRIRIQNFLIQSSQLFGNKVMRTTPTFREMTATTSSFPSSPFREVGRFDDQFNRRNMTVEENPDYAFNLFSHKLSGRRTTFHNLLFSDDTNSLATLSENQQTFSGYLGRGVEVYDKLRTCSVPTAKLCVVSEKEFEKCGRMRTAFRAQMLKPELSCIMAHDSVSCMQYISEGVADIAMMDAGDIYRAGRQYNLIPILAEKYNLNESAYYVVATARQSDKETDLLYLKDKRSCHTGFGEAAGWVIPLSFLLSNNRMRSYGACEAERAASQFFSKSCVPGSLSARFTQGSAWNFGNLCDLCHGESYSYCARDSSEPFYGPTGALRCLVEGNGEIAFTRHTAILENAGKNPSFWSRNVIPDDFELLCRDGSRAKFRDYRTCNLGLVAADALVTHANRPRQHVEAYINLFLLAQQLYGSKFSEDFTLKMFISEPTHTDLIFSDSTSQLVPIPESHRHYRPYLGHQFLKSISYVDCTSSASAISQSVLLTASLFIVFFITV